MYEIGCLEHCLMIIWNIWLQNAEHHKQAHAMQVYVVKRKKED